MPLASRARGSCASPAALFDAGFQLTFLALLAITGICLPILERSSTPYRSALHHLDSTGYDLALEPKIAQFRLDLRLIAGRLAQFIGARAARIIVTGAAAVALGFFELLLVSAITQAVLVLPMRAYFHRAAILGMPANVLVLPLAGLMLNAGVAAIALSYVSMPFARLAATVAAASLHWTLACLHSLSRFHLAQWRVPDPTPLLALLAVAAIVLAFFAVAKTARDSVCRSDRVVSFRRNRRCLSRGTLRSSAANWKLQPSTWVREISLLVVSPEGRTMLIDGGGSTSQVPSEFDFGEDVVAPYLWSRGLESLDVIVLTHAHEDHLGGLPASSEDFHPSELWVALIR